MFGFFGFPSTPKPLNWTLKFAEAYLNNRGRSCQEREIFNSGDYAGAIEDCTQSH